MSMSERLTERVGDGVRYDNGEYIITCYPKNNNLTTVDKLAAKLCDLEDKIENGTLIAPLCKVGQTVYVPWRYGGQRGVAVVRVEEIKFYDSQMHYMFLIDMESDNECFNQSFGGWKIEQSIGKTVFLTPEDAERALAERKNNV